MAERTLPELLRDPFLWEHDNTLIRERAAAEIEQQQGEIRLLRLENDALMEMNNACVDSALHAAKALKARANKEALQHMQAAVRSMACGRDIEGYLSGCSLPPNHTGPCQAIIPFGGVPT